MPDKMGPAARRRWITKTQRSIRRDKPARRDLNFRILLGKELSEETLERLILDMFLELCQFLHDGFGREKTAPGQRSLWDAAYPKQFHYLVNNVARAAADENQWESLLKDPARRCALLQGVILMALEKNVFSSLLFGAASQHTRLLSVEDDSLLGVEGFKRTSLRAETNRVYLGQLNGLPPFFWSEVDKLTAQIMRMLLPLYAMVGNYTDPNDPSGRTSTYQALHDLVAHAAWLSIAFRVSPQVAVWEWARPGEAYSFEQVSIIKEREEPEQRANHGEPRRSRVMVSAAPKITLYRYATDGYREGKMRYTLMRPRVVCYMGHRRDLEDQKASLPLHRHIRRVRYTWKGLFGTVIWTLLKLCLLLWLLILANDLAGRQIAFDTSTLDIVRKVVKNPLKESAMARDIVCMLRRQYISGWTAGDVVDDVMEFGDFV